MVNDRWKMFLSHLSLQNFRNYTKSQFTFNRGTTVIVGPNTAGKSNLIEAIYLLSSGKSFRTETNIQMIRFGEEIGRVKGAITSSSQPSPSMGEGGGEGAKVEHELEVVLTIGQVAGVKAPFAKYLVNGVPKRRVDFMENFHALLFAPSHLDIIVGSPSLRRNFLDEVLESVDREYRLASIAYEKALRQRNALLHLVRETGRRDPKRLEYWDNLLIQNGQLITVKREAFLEFINQQKKELIDFVVEYDRSTISEARLTQYKDAEEATGVTLVGPHRDDFIVLMDSSVHPSPHGGRGQGEGAKKGEEYKEFRYYGSRGQQRLVVLQLKLLQLQFMEEKLGVRPVLLLDDIFSELDDSHIQHVMEIIGQQQTIITTTHREFIDQRKLKDMHVIELEGNGD